MTLNMDDLKARVFGPNAVFDHRFVWAEITPDNLGQQYPAIQDQLSSTEETDGHWSDHRRYRVVDCAHYFRDPDGVCDTCGGAQ